MSLLDATWVKFSHVPRFSPSLLLTLSLCLFQRAATKALPSLSLSGCHHFLFTLTVLNPISVLYDHIHIWHEIIYVIWKSGSKCTLWNLQQNFEQKDICFSFLHWHGCKHKHSIENTCSHGPFALGAKHCLQTHPAASCVFGTGPSVLSWWGNPTHRLTHTHTHAPTHISPQKDSAVSSTSLTSESQSWAQLHHKQFFFFFKSLSTSIILLCWFQVLLIKCHRNVGVTGFLLLHVPFPHLLLHTVNQLVE